MHLLPWDATPPAGCRGGAVAIGNFDGVHLGHASLVSELSIRAKGVSGPAVVLTFDPHPLQLLRPESFQPVLTALADRAELLHACGADEVVVLGRQEQQRAGDPVELDGDVVEAQVHAQLSAVMHEVIQKHLPVSQKARSVENGLALKA